MAKNKAKSARPNHSAEAQCGKKREMSPEQEQKSKKMEKVLVIATLLVFVILLSKSMIFDGMAVRNNPEYQVYYQKIEEGSEFPFSQKLISMREEEGKWKAKVRKYFLYIMPIGDVFVELPPLEELK